MLPQDIERIHSGILGENEAWVPMIWPQEVVSVMRQESWEAGFGILQDSVMQVGVGNFQSWK